MNYVAYTKLFSIAALIGERFRRKILKQGIVEQIDTRKDALGRPSHLFRFNEEMYLKSLAEETSLAFKFGFVVSNNYQRTLTLFIKIKTYKYEKITPFRYYRDTDHFVGR